MEIILLKKWVDKFSVEKKYNNFDGEMTYFIS